MTNKLVLSASLAIVMSASAFATPKWDLKVAQDFSNYETFHQRLEDFNNCQGQAYITRIGAGMIYTDEIKVRCYPTQHKVTPEPQFWSAYDVPVKYTVSAVFYVANQCTGSGGKASIRRNEDSWKTVYTVSCKERD
ncbi:hypothetical protein VPHK369_0103 [Vibrio phage K369]